MAAHAEGLPALAADTVLVFQQANPKTPNTQSYQRYEKYKAAQTLKEFIELGGSHKDLKNDADSSRKFVSINADIYSPAAADTCKQIIAAQKKKKRQAPVDDDVGSTEAPPPAGEDPTKVSEGTTQDSELDSKNTQMVTQPAYFDFDSKDIMLFGHSALTTGPHVLAQCVLTPRPRIGRGPRERPCKGLVGRNPSGPLPRTSHLAACAILRIPPGPLRQSRRRRQGVPPSLSESSGKRFDKKRRRCSHIGTQT